MPRLLHRIGTVTVATAVAAMSAIGLSAAATAAPGAAQGGFSVFSVAAASTPVQLITGTDGRLWFVTSQSQLGIISPAGQVSLLPVTVPHGNTTAVLVGAGPEGVWAYSNTTGASQGCTVSLSSNTQVVTQTALVHPLQPLCDSGARDLVGNGWFAVHGGRLFSGVSRMLKVTQSGQTTLFHTDRPGARPGPVALGSDGAIWVLEFNNHSLGRYASDGTATTVSLSGTETPPYPGSIFFGINARQLLARPDGTFWLFGGNVGLSDPGEWFVRYLFADTGGTAPVATAPDGALWSVLGDRTGPPAERMVRLDATGRVDRSAPLPTGVGGAPMFSTGPAAATPDGSIWTVTSDGSATYVVRFQPTGLTHVAIWTGAGGDGRWSTASNWQGNTPPATGDAVELPTASTMTDDLPGLTLQQLLITGPAHLSGATLSFGVGGVQVKSGVPASLSDPIAIGAAGLRVVADPRSTLTLSGVISGLGGLTVVGAGRSAALVTLIADNTYTGTTNVAAASLAVDGSQPGSAVVVGGQYFGDSVITGSGTTGSLTINSGGQLLNPALVAPGTCPTTLSVQGDLLLAANSYFHPEIVGCGAPLHQAASRVKVTGSVSIDSQSLLFLDTSQDTTQSVCLISSEGTITGSFGNAPEGSTATDYGADAGDLVRFTYRAPGGSGCYAHAFTAQTGIDP